MADLKRTLIVNARIVDPESGYDGPGGLLFDAERILDVGPHVSARAAPSAAEVIDADGLVAAPGVIDLRVTIGEPGAEHRETLKSAGRAAAAGGVTTFVVQPTTAPVIDDASLVDFILRRAPERTKVRVLTAAALTHGLKGEALSEIGLLSEAGARYFSNGDEPIANSRLMRRALSYATAFNALIAHRPQDPWLAQGTAMAEGELALRLGLSGEPSLGERIMLERDLALVELTGARLLVDMISSAEALGPLRAAKAKGLPVGVSASVHHLTLNELAVVGYRTFAKLRPPLRSEDDRTALVEALNEGLIDVIVSSHDPRPAEDKRLPFSEAAHGASALETLLPAALRLYHSGACTLQTVLAALTINPARLLGLPQGRLARGAPADIILVDLDKPWRFDADAMRSKCKNSPFDAATFQGQVRRTIVGAETAFAAGV
jgi:dihydroorotase